MIAVENGDIITFDYVNWKGERGSRTVFVWGVRWGSNQWHKEEQWLLYGLDMDKQEERYFAMNDMENIKVKHF